jgi:ATP-dependent Clp protease ATP-binding subunit ClpB
MTSNIGSQYILEETGSQDWETIEERVRKEMHRHFRPEFLNRIDDIVLFRPLTRIDLRRIVDLQLDRVRALATELGVGLQVSDEVKDRLAEEGFDPVFGARPLKRVIQQRIQNPLALRLLEEEVEEGTVVEVVGGGEGESELAFRFRSPTGAGDPDAGAG